MDVSKLKKEKIKDAINSIITDYGFLNDEIDIEKPTIVFTSLTLKTK